MRKILTAFAAMGFALAAVGQQPQRCVELVNGLVFLGRGDQRVSVFREQPAFMSGVKVPAGLALIGNGVRPDGISLVAYKTSLSAHNALDSVVAALAAHGWEKEITPGTGAGFGAPGRPGEVTLCRAAERRHVVVTEVAGNRYATVGTGGERQRACHADPMADQMAILRGVPRLQFPAGTTLLEGGGGGGSDTQYTTTARIAGGGDAVELVEHLAVELQRQGWHVDARWSGRGGAGSTWRGTVGGQVAAGTLEITPAGDGTYDVDFTITLPR